jgi:hypothetical protein
MNKTSPTYCWFFAGILIISGCVDYFHPEIEDTEKILVVDGILTNEAQPSKIQIFYSNIFGDDSDYEPAQGAVVEISDNNQSHVLTESGPGEYFTAPYRFKAKTGMSYKLKIITINGDSYESNIENMHPLPEIDSVYVQKETREYLYQNSYGDLVPLTKYVYSYYYDAGIKEQQKAYSRITWKAIIQSATYTNTSFTMCWSVFNDHQFSNPFVLNKFDKKNGQSVQKKQFYTIDLDDVENYSTAEEQEGVILAIKHYSLSENLFRFWEQLNSQLTAEGKLFDPIETQIQGNMKCTSDTTKQVFGYFGVSMVKNYNLYMIRHNKDSLYKEKSVIDIDVSGSGCLRNEVPYFWHGKNGKYFIDK